MSNRQIFVRSLRAGSVVVDVPEDATIAKLKTLIQRREGIPCEQQLLTHGGRPLRDDASLLESGLSNNTTIDLALRLFGGKGGFGTNLRAAGKRQLTDNFDACRDLQGRRIRHKTAAAKLEEWQAEAQERELEKLALKHVKDVEREEQRFQEVEVDVHSLRKESKSTLAGVQSAVAFALKKKQQQRAQVDGGDGDVVSKETTSDVKPRVSAGKGSVQMKKGRGMNSLLGLSDDDDDNDDDSDDDGAASDSELEGAVVELRAR